MYEVRTSGVHRPKNTALTRIPVSSLPQSNTHFSRPYCSRRHGLLYTVAHARSLRIGKIMRPVICKPTGWTRRCLHVSRACRPAGAYPLSRRVCIPASAPGARLALAPAMPPWRRRPATVWARGHAASTPLTCPDVPGALFDLKASTAPGTPSGRTVVGSGGRLRGPASARRSGRAPSACEAPRACSA